MNKKQNHIDHLFDKARNQQPKSSFEETSGQFLNDLEVGKTSSLNQGGTKSFNFKNLFMLSFVSVTVITTVIYFNSNTSVEKEGIIVSMEEEFVSSPIENIVIQNEDFVVESITIEDEFITTPVQIRNQASYVTKPKKLDSPGLDYSQNLPSKKNVYIRPTQAKLKFGSQGRKLRVTESL